MNRHALTDHGAERIHAVVAGARRLVRRCLSQRWAASLSWCRFDSTTSSNDGMSTICSYRWGVAWSLASDESTWVAAADFAIDCGATASSLEVRGSIRVLGNDREPHGGLPAVA